MKNIEKQINKLIKEIEECADNVEKLKNEFGITYIREFEDFEHSDLKLKLNRSYTGCSAYFIEKEGAYDFFSDSNELDEELARIESKYTEEEKKDIYKEETEPYILNDREDFVHKYAVKTTELLFDSFKKLKEQAKFLINLLEKHKQKEFIKRVDAIEIEKIQAKKLITVKEFTEIYNRGAEWQRNRRGKIHNKLPFRQEKKGGKVLYNVEEVENWFVNNS